MLSEAPTAGEDAVDHRHLGLARRHERPDLRQQRDQRRLAQVGRLAAHVRARQDDQLARLAVEVDVVRDEGVAGEPFHDRMSSLGDHVLVPIMDVRFGVSWRPPLPRPASTSSDARAGPCPDTRRVPGHLEAGSRFEQLQLPLEMRLIGAEHLLLVLLQRRRWRTVCRRQSSALRWYRKGTHRGWISRSRCSSRTPG